VKKKHRYHHDIGEYNQVQNDGCVGYATPTWKAVGGGMMLEYDHERICRDCEKLQEKLDMKRMKEIRKGKAVSGPKKLKKLNEVEDSVPKSVA